MDGFNRWCSSYSIAPTSLPQLDFALQEYFHDQYFTDGSRQSCSNLLCGVLLVLPNAKHKLSRARLCLRGWAKLAPSVSWPPMSWDLSTLVASFLVCKGSPRAAFAVLLAFDCLLRVSELCALKVSDVAVPDDPRLGSAAPKVFALHLRHTKTGKNLWVQVLSPVVASLFHRFLAGLQPHDRVFPFSAAQFRALFRRYCDDFIGFSAHFTPHSLRHGGATHMYLLRYSLEDIMHRGRWMSNFSARRYIQAGQAHLLQLEEKGSVLADALFVSSRIVRIFDSALCEGGI